MLKITLEGPPASGKTRVAKIIMDNFCTEAYIEVFDEEDSITMRCGDSKNPKRVEIRCIRTEEA